MVPFVSIPVASRVTGLSQYFLRRGVQDGSVPHIRSGAKYLINLPRLLEALDASEAWGGEEERDEG